MTRILLALMALFAFPALALAQEPTKFGTLLAQQFDTAAIVALCSAVASVALAASKYLPGRATKANIVVVVATAIGGAVGALGPQAGAVAIIIAAFGALLGYMRKEARAGK